MNDSILEGFTATLDADQAELIANGFRENQAERIRELIRQSAIGLVILDDAWNDKALYEIVQALPRMLAVVVTSRNRYPMMNLIVVGRFERSRSIQILEYYAARKLSDAPYEDQICELLGDNAFALRIAGLTLYVDGLSPSALYDKIRNAPHDIQIPMNWANDGQESISSLLRVSLNALDKGPYNVFFAFGTLFAPQATVQLIALLHIVREVLERGLSSSIPQLPSQ